METIPATGNRKFPTFADSPLCFRWLLNANDLHNNAGIQKQPTKNSNYEQYWNHTR